MTLPYNLVMLAVDVTAIWLVSRHKRLMVWFGAMALAGLVAMILGAVLAGWEEGHFGVFRLWAYAVFLHGVALLLATAVLWRRRPIGAGAAVAAVVALLLIAADAFLIEPFWLEVSHWRITSPKIHHPLRIVVVADLQTDALGAYERAALRRALEEKPDLILLAGDYVQARLGQQLILEGELRDFLREIHFAAPRGVFAVRGNVDGPDWPEIFRGLGVTTVSDGQSFDLGEPATDLSGLVAIVRPASEDCRLSARSVSSGAGARAQLCAGGGPGRPVGGRAYARWPGASALPGHDNSPLSHSATLGGGPYRIAQRGPAVGLPRPWHGARRRPAHAISLPAGTHGDRPGGRVTAPIAPWREYVIMVGGIKSGPSERKPA